MTERWARLLDFPGYEVSDHGTVYSDKTQRALTLTRNAGGIVKVNLFHDGRLATRAVRVLVADAFLPAPGPEDADVINIDGDQLNNHYLNLAWRPHWFAWKYTRQFREPIPPEYLKAEIYNSLTDTTYENTVEAGIADGVLWEYVFNSALSGRAVYPTGAVYQLAYQVQFRS